MGTGLLAGAGTFASVSAGAEVGSTFSASGSATLSFVVNSTGASISPWLGGMDYCARCMQVVCGRISRSALLSVKPSVYSFKRFACSSVVTVFTRKCLEHCCSP